ncbi:hypothetical protein G3I19_31880 [Streptomyces sp. SID10853]|uniref:hypothetical protein n=1 Tax=Streptomyces sp. SID10853 TaxID=2706028 RepID=UPI0013BF22C2|nr:hypothetical protein [Streptomyces sp. SID10853]NDZ83044.1 hypothetical protein [Streptomyces sp. SID10853]
MVTLPGPPPGPAPRRQTDAEPCQACEEFDLAEAVARAEHDASRETDCRVLRRRHQQADHGGQQP